ncbi:ATP-binding protein [Pseudobutyrivibrio sp. MD2005]|uniref:ATP-binding protein n=1 Tax=Pseudobutyrivibrio sp. MD2005 TaxID=1410616 RepID=UPI00047FAEE8|nr:ATP-binding protein [Pseudobutyrivibrio sp. MD2005]
MFTSKDYFDNNKEKKPYSNPAEHLHDCIQLLDFLIDKTVSFMLNEPTDVYLPGSIMSDSMAQFYYETGPLERNNSVCSDDFKNDFQLALNHIRSREEATGIELPIVTLRQEFDLNFFEELSLLLCIGYSLNINRRNLYAYIANDAALNTPTTGVLFCIYQQIDKDADISMLFNLTNNMGKMNIFFLIPFDNQTSKKSLMEIPLALRDDVFSYILSQENPAQSIPYTRVYEYEKTNLDIFSQLSSYDIKDDGFVYISSEEPEDVLQFIREKNDESILVLNSELLLSDAKGYRPNHVEKQLTHTISMLLFRLRTSDDILCVKMPYPLHEYSSLVLQIINQYLPNKTIYIYGADKFPIELVSSVYRISSIDLPTVDFEERERIWNYFLSKEGMKLNSDINISDLADCYEIAFSKIRYIVTATARKAKWKGETQLDSFELKEQLRHMGESGFMSLAVYIPPVYSIDDLEINDTQKNVLKIACNRFKIKNRVEKKHGIKRSGAYGNGVSVLLCGPPGTGKTMAAQVISKELSLPLYRVDLSQLISKYIGETQKNINEIFDQARKSNVILFFDEADALFSKRTEVKDSNDKYANSETAYLLQKIEGHSGMSILATNLFSNFDAAFVRRLSYVIHLEKPDEATRLNLWQSILPVTVELAKDIDFKFFANKFDFSGSEIKSILYSAMYMAESEGRPLGNKDIARAIQLRPDKHSSINMAAELGKYSGFMLS